MKTIPAVMSIALLFSVQSTAYASDKIRIVATTTPLGSLVEEMTGELADIHTVASPKRDIHFVAPTPKDVLKVKKADVFVHLGLDAEPWREPLLIAAGNSKVMGQGEHAIDTSEGIELLEVPPVISRSEGDIHIFGNPHYWLDPLNAVKMTDTIARKLSALYPEKAQEFSQNAERFKSELKTKTEEWKTRLAPFHNASFVTYHNSWPYFARAFGLRVIGQLEPKPGIPPTSKHLSGLVKSMVENHSKLILIEPHQDKDAAKKVAKMSGAQVVQAVQSVGAVKEAADYIEMMEYNVTQIEKALKTDQRPYVKPPDASNSCQGKV